MHVLHDPNLSKSAKRALWDEVIQDYLKSGRSLRVYCEAHAIKYDHLAYYVSAFKRKQAKHSGFIAVKPVLHRPHKDIQ